MSKTKIIAGIDVGTSKTTTVIASVPEGEEEIKIIGIAIALSKGMRKGQIVNIEEAAEGVVGSVEAAERMAGYHLSRALVGIGGSHLASQNSTGVVAVAESEGEITDDDVNRVIEAAKAVSLPSSRETIHVLPRDFTVDGQEGIKDPVGMSGVRLEVETHIITGSTTAIRNLVKCVSEMGADVQGLIVNGLASAESTLTETEKELGVVLVDIGEGTTDVVIFIEGSPFYTSVLPIGAKNVTNDLAIGLRLSLEAAEKIKFALSGQKKKPALPLKATQVGTAKKGADKKREEDEDEIDLSLLGIEEVKKTVSRKTLVEGIIKPRLNEIFNLVGLEIKKSEAGGLTPSGIVICGGGARTAGVVDAAKKTLSMPVRIGSPQGIGGLIDDAQTPDFATATGLVLYGARTEVPPAGDFSFTRIGTTLRKIPVRGVAGKLIDVIKSFLP